MQKKLPSVQMTRPPHLILVVRPTPRVLGEFFNFPSASIRDLLHPFTSNLVIVSADNSITASISHGTESGASASATFGGVSLIIDVDEHPDCHVHFPSFIF